MNRLAEFRSRKGFSQSKLAADVGVSERHIAFIEKGERAPSIGLALKISVCLDVRVEDIFLPIRCTNSTFEAKST